MDAATMQVTAGIVLGLLVQWAKGPKKLPTWMAYAAIGIVASGLYVWMTPDFTLSATTWRATVAGWLTFIMSARGWGSTARDAKLAPATDSL